jgi:hypothetical protein
MTPLLSITPSVRDAIVDRFVAGDTIALLAWDFELHDLTVEYLVRDALRGKPRKKKRGVRR